MKALVCLLVLMWSLQSKASGPEIIPLSSEEHQKIESIYQQVLLTPSGLSICLIMQADASVLGKLLGLSEVVAQQIAGSCGERAQAIWGKELREYAYFNLENKATMLQRPEKKYYIVDNDSRFPYDSWTDLNNRTFISREAFDSDRLAHVLIHELQIAFDAKARLGSSHLEVLQDGWTSASTNFFKPNVKRDTLELLDKVRNSPLQRVFAIMRAFNFEVSVLSELDGKSEKTQSMNHLYNSERCQNLMTVLVDTALAGHGSEERQRTRELLESVDRTHLRFKYPSRGISEISVCEFMSIPSFSISTFLTEGPRPRIRPSQGWEYEALKMNLTETQRASFQMQIKSLQQKIAVPSQGKELEIQRVLESLQKKEAEVQDGK